MRSRSPGGGPSLGKSTLGPGRLLERAAQRLAWVREAQLLQAPLREAGPGEQALAFLGSSVSRPTSLGRGVSSDEGNKPPPRQCYRGGTERSQGPERCLMTPRGGGFPRPAGEAPQEAQGPGVGWPCSGAHPGGQQVSRHSSAGLTPSLLQQTGDSARGRREPTLWPLASCPAAHSPSRTWNWSAALQKPGGPGSGQGGQDVCQEGTCPGHSPYLGK